MDEKEIATFEQRKTVSCINLGCDTMHKTFASL